MIYIVCFFIALLVLLFLIAFEEIVDVNIVLLVVVVSISNGGYYALTFSKNIEEAILASKIIYVIGIFAPVLVFLIICDLCQIQISKIIKSILYAAQLILYMNVCMIGRSQTFYKTVEYHVEGGFPYLTKIYGPMHTVYLFSLFFYSAACVVVGMYGINKRNVVSRINVDILLFVEILNGGVYFIERFVHLNYELTPIFATVSLFAVLLPTIKVSMYSVSNNMEIFKDEIKNMGCIIFDKNLKYMGCNDYAIALFPELYNWEIDKKVPGNGGRFNTFLRQPLLKYINDDDHDKSESMTYTYKGEVYQYNLGTLLRNEKSVRGYFIQVSNVTDSLEQQKFKREK